MLKKWNHNGLLKPSLELRKLLDTQLRKGQGKQQ